MKIKAHLPRECGHCNQIYSIDLGAPQLFSCCSCMAPSHNCEDISKLHEILPSVYPKGLVWMCEVCLNDAHVGQNPTTIAGPSKMASTDQNEQVPKGEIKKTTDNDVEMVENTNTPKRALCKYYIYKKCRYGSKGDQCPFEHPKKCFKYTQHGTGSGRGFRKGKECNFFHPPLCKSALKDGTCNKEKCHFHHIKGTKFRKSQDDIGEAIYSLPRSETR